MGGADSGASTLPILLIWENLFPCAVKSFNSVGIMSTQRPQLNGYRGLRWWAVWLFGSSHMFMFGLLVASVTGQALGRQRPELVLEPWNHVLIAVVVVCLVWWAVAFFPRPSMSSPSAVPDRLGRTRLILAACVVLLVWQRSSAWSVVCLGPIAAAYLWAWYSKAKWPFPYIAVVGYCVASPAVFLLRWTNDQRFLMVLCLGGVATALQGLFAFRWRFQKLKETTIAKPNPSAGD